MAVFDLFSKRQKREKGEAPEVFTYDKIGQHLRTQIVHIWRDALGTAYSNDVFRNANEAYQMLHKILAREFGLFSLSSDYTDSAFDAVVKYFMAAETEQALDIVQLSFQLIDTFGASVGSDWRRSFSVEISATDAIEELNERFLEQGVGYAFVAADSPGKLIRKDKEFLHREVVLPALHLLHEQEFRGANDEYLHAHEHYRHGRYKECVNECLKAFESTMKTICMKTQVGL